MKRKQKFIANTILLTVVTLILRAVGVSFNSYIANRIGAAGMGLFSLIMSVYQFGITFACSGIGLAATRMVSEELALGNEGGVRRAMRRALQYSLFFGSLAFALIFFGAPLAGTRFLGDARTVEPLKILSVSLPCVAMSAAMNGYFSAVGRVARSAFVQILEQIIRVAGCVILLSGIDKSDAGLSCKAVVASGSVAEVISFLILYIFYRIDLTIYQKHNAGNHITRRLLAISLPVAVSAYMRSALSTVEHAFIPRGLKKHSGDEESALSAYGTVHGMVMPLILFPSAVLSAFSTMLVPEVTMHYKRGNKEKINRLIERALQTTLAFSIGASGLLFFFAEEIGMTMYQNHDVVLFIRIIAPLAVVMYADGVVDAVLKGLNQQVYSMGYNIVDSILAILLIFFLLPTKGIYGYVTIIYITEMVNAFLSINRLLTVSDFQFRPVLWAIIPTLGVVAVCLFVKTLPDFGIGSVGLAGAMYSLVMVLFSDGDKKRTLAKQHAL